jgi:hypothetical protein
MRPSYLRGNTITGRRALPSAEIQATRMARMRQSMR